MILGLAIAVLAACCYEGGYVVQTLETRRVPRREEIEPGLLLRLVRRPLWLAATGLSVAGAALQVLALTQAPLTVVQPTLALGLLLLLFFAHTFLGEPVGRRELGAVAAVVVGVAAIALAAPAESHHTDSDAGLAALLVVLGAITLTPYVLRRRLTDPRPRVWAAAAGDVWAAIGMKLIGDAIAHGSWLPALAWLVGVGVAGLLALTAEMSALQHLPATHIAPVILAGQVLVPVVAAPLLLGESWSNTPLSGGVLATATLLVAVGAATLGRSGGVAEVIAGEHGPAEAARPDDGAEPA
jgi:drug/metabolite transporter (DMT)-like permease